MGVSWADEGVGLVSGVEGVPGIRPFLTLNVDELSVDESGLQSRCLQPPTLPGLLMLVANDVVLVNVDHCEVFSQSAIHIQHAPLLGVDEAHVNLHHDHVYLLQVLHREVLEGLVLGPLNVNLQRPVLTRQVVPLYHVLQGDVGELSVSLSLLPHTLVIESIAAPVFVATGGFGVSAVVLVVWHSMLSSEVTAQGVPPLDADIDEGL